MISITDIKKIKPNVFDSTGSTNLLIGQKYDDNTLYVTTGRYSQARNEPKLFVDRKIKQSYDAAKGIMDMVRIQRNNQKMGDIIAGIEQEDNEEISKLVDKENVNRKVNEMFREKDAEELAENNKPKVEAKTNLIINNLYDYNGDEFRLGRVKLTKYTFDKLARQVLSDIATDADILASDNRILIENLAEGIFNLLRKSNTRKKGDSKNRIVNYENAEKENAINKGFADYKQGLKNRVAEAKYAKSQARDLQKKEKEIADKEEAEEALRIQKEAQEEARLKKIADNTALLEKINKKLQSDKTIKISGKKEPTIMTTDDLNNANISGDFENELNILKAANKPSKYAEDYFKKNKRFKEIQNINDIEERNNALDILRTAIKNNVGFKKENKAELMKYLGSLLTQKGKPKAKGKGYKVITSNGLMDRYNLLVGELSINNNNPAVKNELSQTINLMRSLNMITAAQVGQLTRKYIANI